MSYRTGHNVKFALDPIYWYCEEHRLPPLTSLVVLKTEGVSGDAFVEAHPNFPRVQAEVFSRDWYAVYPPTAQESAELTGH